MKAKSGKIKPKNNDKQEQLSESSDSSLKSNSEIKLLEISHIEKDKLNKKMAKLNINEQDVAQLEEKFQQVSSSSLYDLTKQLEAFVLSDYDPIMDVENLTSLLKTHRRRIYDLFNVFEGCNISMKLSKNCILFTNPMHDKIEVDEPTSKLLTEATIKLIHHMHKIELFNKANEMWQLLREMEEKHTNYMTESEVLDLLKHLKRVDILDNAQNVKANFVEGVVDVSNLNNETQTKSEERNGGDRFRLEEVIDIEEQSIFDLDSEESDTNDTGCFAFFNHDSSSRLGIKRYRLERNETN